MKDISYGSLLISDKIGDGKQQGNRRPANQEGSGGWANLVIEYSTCCYRSNCISWGLINLSVRKGRT